MRLVDRDMLTRSGGTVGVMLGGCVGGQSYLGFRALT